MNNGDLISREAAIMAAINGADRWDGGSNHGREFFIRENINEVPAVDAVEVVRCGECEFIDDKCAHGIVCICDHGGMCGTFVADTDFCSCGKRRMDGE